FALRPPALPAPAKEDRDHLDLQAAQGRVGQRGLRPRHYRRADVLRRSARRRLCPPRPRPLRSDPVGRDPSVIACQVLPLLTFKQSLTNVNCTTKAFRLFVNRAVQAFINSESFP